MNEVDEVARQRFEADWLKTLPQPIASYLPPKNDEKYAATLEELVCIDMEFRWSREVCDLPPRLLESYVIEFPCLSEPVILQRLMNQEIWARAEQVARDATEPPQASEYERRFPDLNVPSSVFGRILGSRVTLALDGEASTQSVDQSLPRQAGPYELLQVLGRGGMGTVYRARHRATGRVVAWKIANISGMPAELRREARARVMQEIRLAAQLSHDHVVPVHDVGEVGGQPFYTMPVLDTDLGTEVRQSPLEGRRAARYIGQAARGIDAAHQSGLLHRDLKPHNLMLDRSRDRVLVADFGLARCIQDPRELTLTGQVLGTPPYMPPEQIRNARTIDERADVYSLGATLYHVLTGRPPFVASDAAETLQLVLNEDPLPPRQQNTTIDLDLDTICVKCLHKEPNLRYQTAAELATDLERYINGQPIEARPLSSFGRLARWQRRNPGLARLTGALATALILLVVVSGIGWFTTQGLLGKTRQLLHRVVDNNRQGQQVVDDLFDFVRTEPMLKQPGSESVHREMLQRGLRHYQKLLELVGENRSLPIDHFIAQVAIGGLTADLDGPAPARREFDRALDLHEDLDVDQKSEIRVRTALGDALNGLAIAHRKLLELDVANETFREAIRVRKDLVAAGPGQVAAARKLANAMMNRGLVLAALGDVDTASDLQSDAQAMRERLLSDQPNDRNLRRDHAMAQFNLARLALVQNDMPEARRLGNSANQSFDLLTRQYSTDWQLWLRHIQCLLLITYIDRQVMDDANVGAALPNGLLKATKYLRSLSSMSPDNRSYRLQLVDLLHNAVDHCLELGHLDEAGNVLETVQIELLSRFEDQDDQPDIVMARLDQERLSALRRLGLVGRAKAISDLRAVLRDWDKFHADRNNRSQHRELIEPPAWSALREIVADHGKM